MRALGWIIGVVVALCLLGCTEPGDTRTFTRNGVSVSVTFSETTPQVEVYRDMERCAGLTGNPSAVRWYALDEPVRFPDGAVWYGAYDTDERAIYYTDLINVRHEILHDLVWTNLHDGGHPSPPFGACELADTHE